MIEVMMVITMMMIVLLMTVVVLIIVYADEFDGGYGNFDDADNIVSGVSGIYLERGGNGFQQTAAGLQIVYSRLRKSR